MNQKQRGKPPDVVGNAFAQFLPAIGQYVYVFVVDPNRAYIHCHNVALLFLFAEEFVPLLDDDFLVFFNYHLDHWGLVCLETVVFHTADFGHDVELGLAGGCSLASHDVDVYRFVVVGVELESQSEEYEQQRHNSIYSLY